MCILEGLFLCPLVKHNDELFQVAESENLVYFSPGRNSFVCLMCVMFYVSGHLWLFSVMTEVMIVRSTNPLQPAISHYVLSIK